MKDMLGYYIAPGDRVAKAERYGSSAAHLEIRTVAHITNGKLYLNDSNVPVKFPERLLVLWGRW